MSASTLGRDLASLKIDPSRRGNSWGGVSRILALLSVLSLIGAGGAAAYQFRDRLKPLPVVQTESVRMMTAAQASTVLTATGYLESRWQAAVGANSVGRIEEINIDEGQKVNKGDVLAVLEHSRLSALLEVNKAAVLQAKAELEQATNAHAQRERDLARVATLRKENTVTQAELEQAETELRVAKAKVSAAQASVTTAEARVSEVEVGIDNMRVYAPFAGTVITKDAELGETIMPGGMGAASGRGSVATIADLDQLEVDTDVKEDYLNDIRKGQPAEIVVDAVRDRRYKGRLREIIPIGDRSRGIVKVKVAVLDPDERLFPELSATVHFLPLGGESLAGATKNNLYLPAAAVVERNGRTTVWRIEAEGRIRSVPVTVEGKAKDGLRPATGKLSAGDTLIVNPPADLSAESRVRIAE